MYTTNRSRSANDDAAAAAKYQSILALVGDRGSGKSSFIAHWVQEFKRDYSFLNVVTHYVESSAGAGGDSVVAMLKRCMAFLSNQLQQNYGTYVNHSPNSINSGNTIIIVHVPTRTDVHLIWRLRCLFDATGTSQR